MRKLTKKHHRPRVRAAHKIEIIPGSPPTVDQLSVSVSKKKKDRVQWWSSSNDWVVVFDGATPFDLHYFSPGKPGNMSIPGGLGSYKYTIFVDGNSADPVIIIGK